MSQILDGGNTSSTSSADNNTDADAGNTNGTRDDNGISGANNNFDNKNAHAKAGFNTYNITNMNTNADASDTTGTRDVDDNGSKDNNTDSKNAYAKFGFSTYNIVNANADISAGIGNTSGMSKKVSNNTNNIGEDQSSRVDGANKSGLGRTNEGKVGGTNIKAKVGVGEANIEAGKKADAGAIASTDNSVDGSGKVTNKHTGLVDLMFAAFAVTNCLDNFDFAIPEGILLGAAIFTSNQFLATFATFANVTLKKKSKMCESNPFLFAVNHQ